ncbi:MAG TPA: hypothetical protein VFZ72_18385 [Jiangellaceae bacterium]
MQTLTNHPSRMRAGTELVYRLEGSLADLYPIGLFPEGLRFHNDFSADIVEGPFKGGRIFGLDQFLVRPDGVGVIVAHEVVEGADARVAFDIRGYVLPPAGLQMPPLEVLASPGFEFPDLDFRVLATALMRTADPRFDHLNQTVVVNEGTVNLGTGRLAIEARAL